MVDGCGSQRRSLVGDEVAACASRNGWSGVLVFGSVRDVTGLSHTDLGVKALGVVPRKTVKKDVGDIGIPVTFGGVTFSMCLYRHHHHHRHHRRYHQHHRHHHHHRQTVPAPGDYVYSDEDGIIVATESLVEESNI